MAGKIKKYRLLGVFAYLDDLLRTLQAVRDSRMSIEAVYSPTPSEEIEAALRLKVSRVSLFTLAGGILGMMIGYGLSAFTALQWSLVIWGKPVLGWVSFSVVAYEFTVLGAVIFTFLGVMILSRSPRLEIPGYYDPRFTVNHYGLLIRCSADQREEASTLLNEAGAKEIHEIEP